MDGTDTLRFIHDDSEEIVGFIKNDSGIYLYIKNIFGDVMGIVDENGSVVVEYEYDVWGKLMSVSGTLAGTLGQLNPIRYRGYYYDSESGYYYLQSRYYDPELRRFINADVLKNLYEPKNTYLYADSVNMFAYCANSPVNMVDYSGEKHLSNVIEVLAYSITFLFEIDEYSKAFVISTGSHKKGKITIKLNKKIDRVSLSKTIYSYYKMLGNNVFVLLAGYSTEKFYSKFKKVYEDYHKKDTTEQRPFLFSDDCVTYEIKQHVLGYWYTEDRIGFGKLPKGLYVGSNFNETELKDRCIDIDILEQDIQKKWDRMYFGYFSGIRDCYMYTEADPFWVSRKKRKSDYIRPDWLKKKIPTYMF